MGKPRDYEALLALLETYAFRPFSWRDHCCVRFAAGVVKAQTGKDTIKGMRWGSARGAAKLIAELGGLEAAIDARLPRIAPAMAQRGDIAGVADPVFGIRLMMVEGVLLVGPGEAGLKRLPRSEMVMAWSADLPDNEAA